MWLTLLFPAWMNVWGAAQPPEVAEMAARTVPKVRIADDREFFDAWNLEYPGMEAVKAAVRAGDLAAGKVALKEYFLQRRQPRWRLNHWEMPATRQGSAGEHPKFREGEDVLAHRFDGYEFGEKIDWNCYPRKYPDGTPDPAVTPSPVTFVHVPNVLGPLYWFSLDERYAKEFADEITDFVKSCPAPETCVFQGPPGWSRLRSINPICGTWFDAYNYFLRSVHFTPEVNALMLQGFIEKARYAVRNPDNVNRYFAQLSGIHAVASYFPELRQSAGMGQFVVRALEAAIREEFYPDTSSKEVCPGYQGMYRSALSRILAHSRDMGREPPREVRDALEGSCDFYVRLATPLRGIPAFGDSGPSAQLAEVFSREILPFIDKPEFRWLAKNGREGSPPAVTSLRLPWAGFYAMRSGWDEKALSLCFDAGPLGKNHWHEDFGNFECYAYGERLVADMGKYSYSFSEWRQYFVSSLAHNVVLVDGLSQNRAADMEAPENVVVTRPRERDWHSDAVFDLAWGVYDRRWGDYRDGNHWFAKWGKSTARHLATHRRDVCFVKDRYWIVSDRLAARGRHSYSQLFHFEPGRQVRVLEDGRARTVDPGRANLLVVQADPVPVEVIEGREHPIQGWYGEGGFDKKPAPVLAFNQEATDRMSYDTVLFPLDVGRDADVRVTRLPASDASGEATPVDQVCALRIETEEGTDYYINDLRQKEIGPQNGRVKHAGPVQTDARAAVAHVGPAGTPGKASAVGGSYVRVDGRAIWPR
ncbi:MAG: alginate lyase family protein [Armatimonadetes bacterium]|nr:alginate lyase family protein [Armatimonadota bacterium]